MYSPLYGSHSALLQKSCKIEHRKYYESENFFKIKDFYSLEKYMRNQLGYQTKYLNDIINDKVFI